MIPHIPDKDRLRMRPDIMILSYDRARAGRTQYDDKDWVDDLKTHATIRIVEVGCCTDPRYHATHNKKLPQHLDLTIPPPEAGSKVEDACPPTLVQWRRLLPNPHRSIVDEALHPRVSPQSPLGAGQPRDINRP